MKEKLFHKALQKVNFKGFPNVDWSCIFHRDAIAMECDIKPCMVRLFVGTLCGLFLLKEEQYKLKLNEKSKILCFQSYFKRRTCVEQYKNICELYHSNSLSCESVKTKLHIIDGFTILFGLMPSWMVTLKLCDVTITQKLFILNKLVKIWYFHQQIKNKIKQVKETKLFVSFYDSLSIECYMVELFKNKHVPTATLQHGQFCAWRENVLENAGIEFRTSNSDYFLCWNKFTIDEAKKEGVPPQKLILAGILGYLNCENIKSKAPGNNSFGVVIGHPMYEEENKKLIESANILAKQCNLKYYLKLHPNYDENHFNFIVNHAYYKGNIKKGIPIINYANSVDLSIVGSSSVFVELVYLEHPILRYSSNNVKDKFRNVHIGKIFSSPNDIVDIFLTEDEDSTALLFDYLCSVKDVKKGYLDFRNRFT